jgi:hypothetical protein
LREEIDRVEESDVIDIKVVQQSARALLLVIASGMECPHVWSVLLIHLVHVLLIDLRGNGLWPNITIRGLSHAKNGSRAKNRGLSPVRNGWHRDRG